MHVPCRHGKNLETLEKADHPEKQENPPQAFIENGKPKSLNQIFNMMENTHKKP